MAKAHTVVEAASAPNTAGRELTQILIRAVLNGPATVMITDLDGTIEYVNRTFCDLTGYTLSDVFGQKVSMLRGDLVSEQLYVDIWAQLKGGDTWSGELQGRKKNGELYWEQASISPIRDDEGRIRHYLRIAENVTQRKQLETELRATVESLERREAELMATCRQLEDATLALRKSQEKLQRLSQEDALTGLLNRRGFFSEMKRVKALSERQQLGIGFLIIDIDYFKEINDAYGHAMGDYILRECAKLLRSHLRLSDLICRYGGDELLVALPGADAETTRLTANRIVTAVRGHDFSKGGRKLAVTVSIGCACGTPVQGHSLDSVVKTADQALYQVKRSGRDGVAYWPDGAASAPAREAVVETCDNSRSQLFRYVYHILVAMLEAREKATGDHSKRVAQMAGVLAEELNLPHASVALIKKGALLHDIGKIAIPDSILMKPAPLSDAEREVVRMHPKTGYDILQSSPEFKEIAEIVLSHQERFDGSGYPRGLKGEKICLGARIFAAIDAYDAIREGRPYAPPRPPGEALRELQQMRGSQFDPDIVDALARCQAKLESVLAAKQPAAPQDSRD